ncbi:MAG: hypothetical protein APR54_01945 [Candidatus Cloacimonas sp. SDB]|nr:MAG: hypothetical protein APR54_01945 [Candidatus Cloacimonas sp. SDB]
MKSKGQILSGMILVLLGLLIIFLKFSTFRHPDSFLLLIGGLFLAAYFYQNAYGLLIPACLMLGISLSSGYSALPGFSRSGPWGLGFGFIAIFIIDFLYRGKSHWWPLIPGVILVLTSLRRASYWLQRGWPVLIILLGIYLIIRSFKTQEKPNSSDRDNSFRSGEDQNAK